MPGNIFARIGKGACELHKLYIGNRTVLVPTFESENDKIAYQETFPKQAL